MLITSKATETANKSAKKCPPKKVSSSTEATWFTAPRHGISDIWPSGRDLSWKQIGGPSIEFLDLPDSLPQGNQTDYSFLECVKTDVLYIEGQFDLESFFPDLHLSRLFSLIKLFFCRLEDDLIVSRSISGKYDPKRDAGSSPVDCRVTKWSEYGPCSPTCGIRRRERYQSC